MRQYLARPPRAATPRAPDATGERLRLQSHRIVGHLEQKVAELSAANERLREMERLRTEFYRNISHELATPMTPIVGYLRMLLDEELGPLNKPQMKALRAMDDCVRRLRGVARQPDRRDRARDGQDALLPPRVRLPRHRAPRRSPRTPTPFAERRITLLEEMPRGPLPALRRLRAPRRARSSQLLDNAASSRRRAGTVGVRVRVLESALRAARRRQRAGRCAGPGGAGLRAVLPGRRVAHARARRRRCRASPSRAGWRADSAETCKLTGGATVEGAYLTGAAFCADRREARADGRGRLDQLSGRDGAPDAGLSRLERHDAAARRGRSTRWRAAREAWGNPSSVHAAREGGARAAWRTRARPWRRSPGAIRATWS